MSSTKTDEAIVIETGDRYTIFSLTFHPDGAHLFSGAVDGIRRWRVADGQEVGTRMGTNPTRAISVSRDRKWIVCGTSKGASVWDAKTQEKTIEVESGTSINTVDISPDSTRFAAGTTVPNDKKSSIAIWNILTGERLVGLLQHDGFAISGVKFSPNGERIATVCPAENSLHVFDSHNGDQLVRINDIGLSKTRWIAITPLAWSSNQNIFVAPGSRTIMSFNVSTGSQLAEWKVDDDGNVESIALASNGKFLATFSGPSITFWDTSTRTQIGPVIQDGEKIWSVALSPDCSYLATGRFDGNITIRNLSNILPDFYGPFLPVALVKEDPELETPKYNPQQQRDEQPSTLDLHDNKPLGSTPEQPTTSGQPELETHHEDGDDDLLEVDLPSSTPAELFDYSEPPSPASSAGPHKAHVTPPCSLQVIPRLAGHLSIVPPPETPSYPLDTPDSPKWISALKRWLPARFKKINRNQPEGSQPPHQLAIRSGEPINLGLNSQSQSRENTPKKGPPRMAAGQRARRTVWKTVDSSKGNVKTARASYQNKDLTSNGQGSAGTQQAGTVQQGHGPPQPLAVPGVHAHVTQETGDATVSFACAFNLKLPAWILCFRSGAEDGRH